MEIGFVYKTVTWQLVGCRPWKGFKNSRSKAKSTLSLGFGSPACQVVSSPFPSFKMA